MESKDNLNKIRFYYNNCAENSPTPTELEWFYTIEKDLDRLEKLEKSNKIILDKVVDVNREVVFRNSYSEYVCYMAKQYPPKHILLKDEWDLLKEVFG